MKTVAFFLIAAFVLLASASFAQENKPVFENACLSKTAGGAPCVQLSWTKGAVSTAYYLVEKSADGKEFKPVAVVFTSDDTQWTLYKYRDKSVTASDGAVYYRIATVSEQNALNYLPVTKVNITGGEAVAANQDAGATVPGK